jgi:FtsP/CotA-like multicopper oxidase with cupredoxin domain
MADKLKPISTPLEKQEAEAPGASRRQFFQRALALASAIAVVEPLSAQQTQPSCPAQPTGGVTGTAQSGAQLPTIGEIARDANGVLRATVTIRDEDKWVWTASANKNDPGNFYAQPYCPNSAERMRFFSGAVTGGNQVWPGTAEKGIPTAGPTLRASVGDLVNITLLNQVDIKNFPNTLDLAEQGKSQGCDVSTTLVGPIGNQTRQQVYPLRDKEPDCLHGSSSGNLHFHGFHVTPGTVGDNVLVQIRPSPRDPRTNAPVVTEKSVKASFDQVFDMTGHGHGPKTWRELPKPYTDQQETLLKQYDLKVPIAHLWEADQKAIAAGEWAQYYIGAYPNAFRITEYNKPLGPGGPPAVMGQAPGTHWYHSHKHGSTALNSFNGMSGVFIVEGQYDRDLNRFYNGKGPGGTGLQQHVMVIQQYAAALNLMSAQGSPAPNAQGTTKEPLVFVNGVHQPYVTMRPGETQLWRMLNACAQVQVGITGITPVPSASAVAQGQVTYKQIAQDGVQFHQKNFDLPSNTNPAFRLSAGNRADLLVQAPSTAGTYSMNIATYPFPGVLNSPAPTTTLVTIQVAGAPIAPMGFPNGTDYPTFPQFLTDIDPRTIFIRREIVFNSLQGIGHANPGPNGTLPPQHTINGGQFENDVINQIMELGTAEEWTLKNTTTIVQHPFHIHINPFQIVEVFDPSLDPNIDPENPYASKQCFVPLQAPYKWWDTIGIPAAVTAKSIVIPGHVKIRHRFDDFTGMYVFHCHILAHEDRGMMQLVQVVSNKTTVQHYH